MELTSADAAAYDFDTIKSERAFESTRKRSKVVVLPKDNELQ